MILQTRIRENCTKKFNMPRFKRRKTSHEPEDLQPARTLGILHSFNTPTVSRSVLILADYDPEDDPRLSSEGESDNSVQDDATGREHYELVGYATHLASLAKIHHLIFVL